MTRILIVDDHPLVRTGFAQLIGDCPDLEVCGEAGDMGEALKRVEETSPDRARAVTPCVARSPAARPR